ncbi:ribulose-phosphate 3-epimerase [bacterium]|nr:ribulose-phosphate 3-epimerase [bacterium]
MGMIEISPSILAADFGRLADEIAVVERAGADSIHLDVMDGHFVPNISFGPPVIRSVRNVTTLPLWAHLMIDNPESYIETFAAAGADGIIVHLEVQADASDLCAAIHSLGVKAGIAINPDTGVTGLQETLRRFDRILVMTVYPGFGGQAFMPGPLETIGTVVSWSGMPPVEVDGGVDLKTAPRIIRAGARILVAGSAIFRAPDPAGALKTLRTVAEQALD